MSTRIIMMIKAVFLECPGVSNHNAKRQEEKTAKTTFKKQLLLVINLDE